MIKQWFTGNSYASAMAKKHSTTKFGPRTKEFCLKYPQFRLLHLCPTCNETTSKEGSAEDDCPKYCECDGGWRPPTTTPEDLKHKTF